MHIGQMFMEIFVSWILMLYNKLVSTATFIICTAVWLLFTLLAIAKQATNNYSYLKSKCWNFQARTVRNNA